MIFALASDLNQLPLRNLVSEVWPYPVLAVVSEVLWLDPTISRK